jgi:hypothetical protein
MSPPEVWGPAIWTFFHTIVSKINENAYDSIYVQLFSKIKKICGYLPCPECSIHATDFLEKINVNNLRCKQDFVTMFYVFHNIVNKRKRKSLFNYADISIYENYNLIPVVNNFIARYNTKGNMKLLTESFQRQFVVKDFKNWFVANISVFVKPRIMPFIPQINIEQSVKKIE